MFMMSGEANPTKCFFLQRNSIINPEIVYIQQEINKEEMSKMKFGLGVVMVDTNMKTSLSCV